MGATLLTRDVNMDSEAMTEKQQNLLFPSRNEQETDSKTSVDWKFHSQAFLAY